MSFLPASALTLQVQPTDRTCAQTCLAMCLGVPALDVIKVLGLEGMCHRGLIAALERFRVLHNIFVFPEVIFSGWYFATVPSLNHSGGNHQVLMHWDAETGKHTVLDPARGKTYAQDGSDLHSWSELVYFHPGGRLPEAGK